MSTPRVIQDILNLKDKMSSLSKKSEIIEADISSLSKKSEIIESTISSLSKKSEIIEATISAASWTGDSVPYIYILDVTGVTAYSNQEILPAMDITQEQLDALHDANIVDGGQAAGSITLKALGDKPSIDIPIRVIKRGD